MRRKSLTRNTCTIWNELVNSYEASVGDTLSHFTFSLSSWQHSNDYYQLFTIATISLHTISLSSASNQHHLSPFTSYFARQTSRSSPNESINFFLITKVFHPFHTPMKGKTLFLQDFYTATISSQSIHPCCLSPLPPYPPLKQTNKKVNNFNLLKLYIYSRCLLLRCCCCFGT